MIDELLIEIGVEELPALPFLKELPNIKDKWDKILKENSLVCDFEFYYTPRRLVFISYSFLQKQPDFKKEFFGAPAQISFKDGKPTPAALGFAKKCGVGIDEIGRAYKNEKEVLYFEKSVLGLSSKELLPSMIKSFLKELNFGKTMRWGDNKENFIRPIRFISCLLGRENIPMNIYGVSSKKETYGHRTHTYEALRYDSISSYEKLLSENSVILNQGKRREKILKEFEEIEKAQDIKIEIDKDLLEEVVAITEYPTALFGTFDKEFLKLPPEVVITSMKEHQRYFPVFKDKKLSEHFVFISNADTSSYEQIIKGNEKVLHPRLSDALFFYKNDIKNGLKNEGLKNITFMKGLGSIYEKCVREEKIAQYLLKDATKKELLQRAVMFAKADLLSDMVYEFTELQGLMGYYYAIEAKEDENISKAFKEQYLPDGEKSELPSSDFSAIVALSNKIETLLALFSKGKIPTGTKDPFALRRAVLGIIRIVIDREFSFDIRDDLQNLAKPYDDFDFKLLENFFLERLSGYINANPSVINAVFKSGERDIIEIYKKVLALNQIVEQKHFKESFSTFKRVANIIKDMELEDKISVDKMLFEKVEEGELYEAFVQVFNKEYKNYRDKLDALFGLKKEIDNFFDKVMVNVEDAKIKNNRKNLIALIYQDFKSIADIKEISI